jgi:hypothetical protein
MPFKISLHRKAKLSLENGDAMTLRSNFHFQIADFFIILPHPTTHTLINPLPTNHRRSHPQHHPQHSLPQQESSAS